MKSTCATDTKDCYQWPKPMIYSSTCREQNRKRGQCVKKMTGCHIKRVGFWQSRKTLKVYYRT